MDTKYLFISTSVLSTYLARSSNLFSSQLCIPFNIFVKPLSLISAVLMHIIITHLLLHGSPINGKYFNLWEKWILFSQDPSAANSFLLVMGIGSPSLLHEADFNWFDLVQVLYVNHSCSEFMGAAANSYAKDGISQQSSPETLFNNCWCWAIGRTLDRESHSVHPFHRIVQMEMFFTEK